MKLAAVALDYDGTIAVNNAMNASVRAAIGEVRDAGIAVILATGRRLDDLRGVAGDLTCFDVVVAENGAVVDFPLRGRHVVLGHAPHPGFVAELKRRGVACEAGEALVEADHAGSTACSGMASLPRAFATSKGRAKRRQSATSSRIWTRRSGRATNASRQTSRPMRKPLR